MQTITSVEAQNNFWKIMNTIPREPVVITKHGRKHAIVLPYEEAIELGKMSIDSLSKETQEQYKKNAWKDRSTFVSF